MMNLKLTGAALAGLGLLVGAFSAQAADIPIKAPYLKAPRSVVAYYNWTGFYLGINGGYGWGSSDWSAVPTASNNPSGGLFGATFGYNYQVGSIVYGIEGDFDWANVKGDAACAAIVTCSTENTWLATFRGRLGYAFDRWLPYLTGGGAWGHVKASASVPAIGVASSSSDQFGWTFGAGLEYAFLGNWTAKLEYLYVDLGRFNSVPAPLTNDVSFKENIIRAGINYKFSGPVFGGGY